MLIEKGAESFACGTFVFVPFCGVLGQNVGERDRVVVEFLTMSLYPAYRYANDASICVSMDVVRVREQYKHTSSAQVTLCSVSSLFISYTPSTITTKSNLLNRLYYTHRDQGWACRHHRGAISHAEINIFQMVKINRPSKLQTYTDG